MTAPDVPDAAVEVAVTGLGPSMISMENARKILAALAAAGWLHDPAEVAALRAVAAAAREYVAAGVDGRPVADAWEVMYDALDAAGSGAK